jgi:hypothetical protein
VRDFFLCGGAAKSLSAWAESEAETEYLLSHRATLGSVVFDPCLGSSTTLKAIAIDQDPGAIALTKERWRESRAKRTASAQVLEGRSPC